MVRAVASDWRDMVGGSTRTSAVRTWIKTNKVCVLIGPATRVSGNASDTCSPLSSRLAGVLADYIAVLGPPPVDAIDDDLAVICVIAPTLLSRGL